MTQLDHPEKSFLLSLSNFLARTKKGKEGECEAGRRRKKVLRQKRVSWGLKLLTRWLRVIIFDIKVPKCNVPNIQWITRFCVMCPQQQWKKLFSKLPNLFQIEGQRMAEQYVARSRGSKICLHLEAASFHIQAGLCLSFSKCYVSLRSGLEIITNSHLPINKDYLMGQLTCGVGIVQWLPHLCDLSCPKQEKKWNEVEYFAIA